MVKHVCIPQKVDAARKDVFNRISKIRFMRHIKKYDPTFNQKEFLAQAHHIYIQAHKCIERYGYTMTV